MKMEYVIIIGIALILILQVVILLKSGSKASEDRDGCRIARDQIDEININTQRLVSDCTQDVARQIDSQTNNFNSQISLASQSLRNEQGETRREILKSISENQTAQRKELVDNINAQRTELTSTLNGLSGKFADMNNHITKTLGDIQESNSSSLKELIKENQEAMDRINATVNEKLQKTLEDRISKSFQTVQTQLSEVYKGLGEMKDVASGVTDLKKVLTNVKTRGIVGEYQLDAILSEILTKDQYEVQCAVNPNSTERVDFAIRLPGASLDDKDSVYLPIDAKFPGDSYFNLTEAYDSGDVDRIKSARTQLMTTIKVEAKSIHDKYIAPPHTTDFAVMFLPFEGLYSEVVSMGLVEVLQNSYKVSIAGPSTMAAMLNSFRMGFRTLAIQKRSGEVWKVLEATKKEFSNFEAGLNKMKERLNQADTELDKLIGTRTNAINRKLREVSSTETRQEADEILGLPDPED